MVFSYLFAKIAKEALKNSKCSFKVIFMPRFRVTIMQMVFAENKQFRRSTPLISKIVPMLLQLRKLVMEEWLAVSSSWRLTSHALYYKIPQIQHYFFLFFTQSLRNIKSLQGIKAKKCNFTRQTTESTAEGTNYQQCPWSLEPFK